MGMLFSNLVNIFGWNALVSISWKDSRKTLILYGTGAKLAALFSERFAAVLL